MGPCHTARGTVMVPCISHATADMRCREQWLVSLGFCRFSIANHTVNQDNETESKRWERHYFLLADAISSSHGALLHLGMHIQLAEVERGSRCKACRLQGMSMEPWVYL